MNTNKKKIPNDEEFKKIIQDRELDLLERGEKHYVYDQDGEVVELKKSTLWYDNQGKYIKPKSSQEFNCIIN